MPIKAKICATIVYIMADMKGNDSPRLGKPAKLGSKVKVVSIELLSCHVSKSTNDPFQSVCRVCPGERPEKNRSESPLVHDDDDDDDASC